MIKIRNPERIDVFTSELNRIWKTYFPDWNFYELFSKFFQRFNRMNFYICEDDRILLLLKVFYYENNFDEKYEIWKDIKNYEGYYMISNYGRVKSLDRYVKTKNNSVKLHKGKILNLEIDRLGYKFVHVCKEGVDDRLLVHRLVAEAFIKNDDCLPIVNHKDEKPYNCHVDNLEWCTYSYNNQYNNLNYRRFKTRSENIISEKVRIGKPILLFDESMKLIKNFPNAEHLGRFLGIESSKVRYIATHNHLYNNYYIYFQGDKYEKSE